MLSPFSIYPKTTQKLMRRLKTPTQVQRWLHSLTYHMGDSMWTLSQVVRHKKAHCLEAVLAAAATLEPHGYPPLILDLESADLLDHTLLLYQYRSRYGTIGKSRDKGLCGRKPVFKNIRALVQSYALPYIDHKAAIKGYGVLDLRTLPSGAWRSSNKNVWYVEDALRNMPHTKFSIPKKTLAYWRQSYIAFRKKHPHREPDYYPNQESWV